MSAKDEATPRREGAGAASLVERARLVEQRRTPLPGLDLQPQGLQRIADHDGAQREGRIREIDAQLEAVRGVASVDFSL